MENKMSKILSVKVKELDVEHDGKKYSVIQPPIEAINKGDYIKSKVFYDAVSNNVPTEDQIMDLMIKRKIFDNDKFIKDISELAIKIADLTNELEKAKNEDSLDELFNEIRSKRSELNSVIMKRQKMIQHSAEFKAMIEQNTFLLGCCAKDEKGEYIFRVIDPINKEIDAQATYESVCNFEDTQLVIALSRKFYPFINGILNPRENEEEYEVYSKRRRELGLEDNDITKETNSLDKILSQEDEDEDDSITVNLNKNLNKKIKDEELDDKKEEVTKNGNLLSLINKNKVEKQFSEENNKDQVKNVKIIEDTKINDDKDDSPKELNNFELKENSGTLVAPGTKNKDFIRDDDDDRSSSSKMLEHFNPADTKVVNSGTPGSPIISPKSNK